MALGIFGSLVASYLYAKGITSDWWFKFLIIASGLFYVVAIVFVNSLFLKMKLAIADAGRIFDLQNKIEQLNTNSNNYHWNHREINNAVQQAAEDR